MLFTFDSIVDTIVSSLAQTLQNRKGQVVLSTTTYSPGLLTVYNRIDSEWHI